MQAREPQPIVVVRIRALVVEIQSTEAGVGTVIAVATAAREGKQIDA